MPLNRYRQSIHTFLRHTQIAPVGAMYQIHRWYHRGGREEFINAFEHEARLRLASVNRSDKALIEQAFPKNVNEYDGKAAWDQYYVANGLIALRQLDKILAMQAVPLEEPRIYYINLIGVLQGLFLDTLVLIEDWATFKAQVPGLVGIGKSRFESSVAIYHSALQVIYGNYSPFAYSDNHSDTSINQLRMAIETRLRRGFGIVAKMTHTDAIVPLALSDIIDAIRPHKASIAFALAFDHIERLYGWANIYMHSGFKQYRWSPIFALDQLRPFIVGGKYSKGMSAKAGIQAPRGVVKQIQAAVEAGIDKTRHKLVVSEPEDCELVLI